MCPRPPAALAALLSTSLLAGCAGTPSLPPPLLSPPGLPAGGPDIATDAPPSQWWRLYQAPELDALVQAALAANPDIRAADARLQSARAVAAATRRAHGPVTDVTAGAGAGSTIQDQIAAAADGGPIRTGSRFDLGGEASWEADVFGRSRSADQAARAEAAASRATADGVRILIVAEVTQAWLHACGYGRQIDIAHRALALDDRGRDLAERLRTAGADSPADVSRARIRLARAAAAVPELEAQRHAALTELAVLTGHAPTLAPAAAAACSDIPTLTTPLPAGDGPSLLRRRPDVRAAEQRLTAATARVGVAVADLYPRISFDAYDAASSPTAGGLGIPANAVWRIGPLISWTIPVNSVARARVREARADAAAALADFDASVLAALKDVDIAADGYEAALMRQGQLRTAAAQSAKAGRLMQARRRAGDATALQALDAERDDLAAQADLAVADQAVAARQVFLFKALGGGWEAAPAQPVPVAPATPPAR